MWLAKLKFEQNRFYKLLEEHPDISIGDAARAHGITYEQAWRWKKQRQQNPFFAPQIETSRKKIILPSKEELTRHCVERYQNQGVVANSWKELVIELKEKFDGLREFKESSIKNCLRKFTPLRSRQAKRKPFLANTRGFHQRQLVASSFVAQLLLSDSPLVFFDETIISQQNFKQKAIGTKVLQPLAFKMYSKSIRFLVMFSLSGEIVFQVVSKTPNSEVIMNFFRNAVPKLLQKLPNPKHERLVVFLDNARSQKTKAFQDLTKTLPLNLIYSIPSSPYINLIEDLFLRAKRALRQTFYETNYDINSVVLQNFKDSIGEGYDWIIRRFVENVKSRQQHLDYSVGQDGRPLIGKRPPPDIEAPGTQGLGPPKVRLKRT